jgi:hypothetical protein
MVQLPYRHFVDEPLVVGVVVYCCSTIRCSFALLCMHAHAARLLHQCVSVPARSLY